jgi:hypothetical protein
MIPKSSLYFQLIHKIHRSRPAQSEGTHSNYGKKDGDSSVAYVYSE